MSTAASPAPSGLGPGAETPLWHALNVTSALDAAGVDAQLGLSSAEAAARARRFGPNKFVTARPEPRWHAFARQYRDPMQIVLLVAGIGSLYPLKQLGTGVLLIFLTLFNSRDRGSAPAQREGIDRDSQIGRDPGPDDHR